MLCSSKPYQILNEIVQRKKYTPWYKIVFVFDPRIVDDDTSTMVNKEMTLVEGDLNIYNQ